MKSYRYFSFGGNQYKIEARNSKGEISFSVFRKTWFMPVGTYNKWLFVGVFSSTQQHPISFMADAVKHAKKYICNPAPPMKDTKA